MLNQSMMSQNRPGCLFMVWCLAVALLFVLGLPASEMHAAVPEQTEYYSIQFMAIPLAHKEKGHAIYEQLKAKGYFVYFLKIDVKGTNWMRLKAGLFPTVTQAKEFGNNFKKQEGFDFFITNADVRVYAPDAENEIVTTPNALWMINKTGSREMLLFSPETIESVDVLDRTETTLSQDKTQVICNHGSRQYVIQLIEQLQLPIDEETKHDTELEDGDAAALYEKGFAYYKQEELDQAKVYFNKTLSLDPQHVSAYYYRGIVHYRQALYDQAIADCTSALKINPRHTEAYNIRALVWLEKGEIDRAIRDCDRVLKMDPQNIAAYSTLGVAWIQKGELEWGCSDLRKACDLGRCETLETVRKQGYCETP